MNDQRQAQWVLTIMPPIPQTLPPNSPFPRPPNTLQSRNPLLPININARDPRSRPLWNPVPLYTLLLNLYDKACEHLLRRYFPCGLLSMLYYPTIQ